MYVHPCELRTYIRSYKVKSKYGSNKIKFAQYIRIRMYVYMRIGSIRK